MVVGEPVPTPELLARIEAVTVQPAAIGGREIMATLGIHIAVHYKGDDDAIALLRDPVNEVDGRVETMIRSHLAEEFSNHGMIGEEMAVQPGLGSDFVWAVDPIDGTSSFINGFPLFASSVGVMYRGVPLVDALWCSTSHLLTPGVYHSGGSAGLRFEGEQVSRMPLPPFVNGLRVSRPPFANGLRVIRMVSLVSGRGMGARQDRPAIECAFVAAGLLQVARFATPNIWDVSGE